MKSASPLPDKGHTATSENHKRYLECPFELAIKDRVNKNLL